tara:strand:+ start:91 stop:213 length:123 start_codon:yes stop_codon:yes gene_type:complete
LQCNLISIDVTRGQENGDPRWAEESGGHRDQEYLRAAALV